MPTVYEKVLQCLHFNCLTELLNKDSKHMKMENGISSASAGTDFQHCQNKSPASDTNRPYRKTYGKYWPILLALAIYRSTLNCRHATEETAIAIDVKCVKC